MSNRDRIPGLFLRLGGAFLAALLISACGGNGGTLVLETGAGALGTPGEKPLFSQWNEASGLYRLDLTAAQFGVQSNASVSVITGQSCTCKVLIQGAEASGNVSVSQCTGTDATCASFNTGGTGTYTKSSSGLQICSAPSSCQSLK